MSTANVTNESALEFLHRARGAWSTAMDEQPKQNELASPAQVDTKEKEVNIRRIQESQFRSVLSGQSQTVSSLLNAQGLSKTQIDKVVSDIGESGDAYLNSVLNCPNLVSVEWGSANPDTTLAIPLIIDQLKLLLLLAYSAGNNSDKKQIYACLSGLSISGWMGLFHEAYREAGCRTFGIPLSFKDESLPEAVPEGMNPEDQCPGLSSIGPRTDAFGLCNAVSYTVWPGGAGSLYEVFWKIVNAQLRFPTISPFSELERYVPPLFMIDYYQGRSILDYLPDERKDHAKAMLDIVGEGWHYQGLFEMLCRITLGAHGKAKDFSQIDFIRIGEGENTKGNFAPRVRYFETPEAASAFILKKKARFAAEAYPKYPLGS